ncbi:acetylxylan esterase [Psychrobacillus sp. INOP01]|uniref:acetylxylan esterase n=1 Tax=Psychrobacillus sp. INOP01 TaxID=2829187 RepID=UPI001BA5E84E|nr:acetylxylan esterase [Psychrobacillus sp. INOP01]
MDALHFCTNTHIPILMGIGLDDPVTPPSTAYAVFNHRPSENKTIHAYPHYVHEHKPFHEEKKVTFKYKQFFG